MKDKLPFLIIMAMRGEADPIIQALKLEPIPHVFGVDLPTLGYKGALPEGRPVYLLVNGTDPELGIDMIGTQISSVTTVLGIREFKPCAIFNFGTCGALKRRGAEIAELYLCTDRVWYHTRRIPLPGWDKFGWGGYPTAGTAELAEELGFKAGTLSTTDSLDHPPIDAERFKHIEADVADMEGAAIAHLAHLHGIPFYALKGVTDLMDVNKVVGEQFLKNFEKVVGNLRVGAERLLGKKFDSRFF